MTAPRVCFVLPVSHPAGAERIVLELARRLPAHGFVPSVIFLEDAAGGVGSELERLGVPVSALGVSRRRSRACATRLAELLPADRPLIVHAHLFHANLAARFALSRLAASSRVGVSTISTVHVAERRFRPWQFRLDRRTAALAEVEVCVSSDVERFHRARTGLDPEFLRVIENGVDLERFSPTSGSPGPGSEPALVAVGRLDPQKEYPTLLATFERVGERFPLARLRIAGEGPLRDRLRRRAAARGLDRVEFLGHVDDVPALLHRSDLFAQLSGWEGFGLAAVEAMACALPVVVSDVEGLREVVADGRTGRVVPRRDPERAARAIVEILESPERAAELGRAAREEAVRRFSVDRMVADYAALYREILGRAG